MKRQLLKDSIWLAIASALGRASTVISSILIARWLGKDQFGLVAITQSTVLMFGGFLGVGFGTAATKIVAEQRAKDGRWLAGGIALLEMSNLVLALLAAVTLLLARRWISSTIFSSPEIADLLVPGAWLLVATAVNFYQIGLLAGLQEFRGNAFANGVSCFVSLPAVVVGVWAGGTTGAITGHAVGMACSCLIFQWQIKVACDRQGVDRSFSGINRHLAMLWRLALPNVLLSSINAPIDWACLAILAHHDSGAGEVAIFCACNQWCLLLRFMPMTIAAALLPAVAHAAVEGRLATKKLLSFALLLNGTFAGVLAFVLALASPWVMECYGPEFAESTYVLVLLLVAGVAIAVQLAAERLLAGLDCVWTAFWFNAVRGGAYVGMAIGLMAYGAIGLAAARCITCGLHAIVTVVAAYQLIDCSSPVENLEDQHSSPSFLLADLKCLPREQAA